MHVFNKKLPLLTVVTFSISASCNNKESERSFSESVIDKYTKYSKNDSVFKKDVLYALDGKTSSVKTANSNLIGIKNFIDNNVLMTMISYQTDANGNSTIPGSVISNYQIGDDNINFGHYFNFPTGIYKWQTGNDNVYSLMYEFDEKGNVKSELGNPLVGGVNNRQTKLREVYFSTVFYNIDSVLISTPDKENYRNVAVNESPLLPMMSSLQLDISNDSVFYLKSYCRKGKERTPKVYLDTITIR